MIAIFVSSILLAGCGDTTEKNNRNNQDEIPIMIEAKLEVPEKAEVGSDVVLAVAVTQGGDVVEDANEVKFEIWKDGQKEESEMVDANLSENGKYISNYTFNDNGIYHVQSHVTARNMHTMPEKTIQIGDVEAYQEHTDGSGEDSASQNEHAEGSDEHSHHHDSDVSIHLNTPEHMNTNEPTSLVVQIEKGQQPLLKANVRLEIFQEASNPVWANMEEAVNGEYKIEHQFPSSGKYTIRVHVTNDEGLHEHTEIEVNVH